MNNVANEYQKAIEQLVLSGYTILQVEVSPGEFLFFVVYKWQEGYFNTAQSIDFNTVEGINITDFLEKAAATHRNHVEFINNFNRVMEDSVVVRCEFAKNTNWYKWSSGVNKNGNSTI